MKTNHRITLAIMTALSAHAVIALGADTADSAAATADSSNSLQEVTVTATRRSESAQNVPITIQAITGDQLQQLGVTSFEDVVQFLPNVTFGANGPGQGEIYMRGLSAGPAAGEQSSASILPFPNVAVYLDDQSMQFPGRNVDIYMADMQRIEVLEGPQGTLFGGGAEAGAIRYITNKPDVNKFAADTSAMYGVTAHGDPNQSIQAMINLPVIDGTFALRGVIYDERRGGYIDNLPSTFTRAPTDQGAQDLQVPTAGNDVQANNFGLAERAQNPVTYGGIRVEGLWQMNDDWSALVTQSYQNMDAEGSFAQYEYGSDAGINPNAPQQLGPWEGTFFTPSWDKDKFENTSLTLNGKAGPLSLVYSGAYMVRNIDQAGDYTNYSRSSSGYYYNCSGTAANGTAADYPGTTFKCYNPALAWHDITSNRHLSNELRLSTPDDWRLRGLFGLYQENFTIADDMNFQYNNLPGCTSADVTAGTTCAGSLGPVSTYGSANLDPTDPSLRPTEVTYGEDLHRGYSQYAAFTSIDFDLIPKVLTITGGTRFYHYNDYEFGTRYAGPCPDELACSPSYGSANVIGYSNGSPATYSGYESSYHGFRSRGNLTWHITDDAMAYYTFSQGFRPGGFNRFRKEFADIPVCTNGATATAGSKTTACGGAAATAGAAQFQSPAGYAPDTLTNNEVGLKTSWFEHRLQANVSLYDMKWNNAQFIFFDPSQGFGGSNFVMNGPDYTIKGMELQLIARPFTGLTLQWSSSFNSANQDNSVCLPSSLTPGTCVTQSLKGSTVYDITSPLGEPNTRPAMSPAVQFSLQARYDMNLFSDYHSWISVGASHTGTMNNMPTGYQVQDIVNATTPPTSVRDFFQQPGYTTYDASLGIAKDAWTVTLFGQNLSNSDASTYTNTSQYILMEVPLRPRVLGLRVDYKFN